VKGALSMEYIVTRWPDSPASATQQAAITVTVTAANHLEALGISGLKEPSALINVNGQTDLNIRYQVNSDGCIIELAHYGSVDKDPNSIIPLA